MRYPARPSADGAASSLPTAAPKNPPCTRHWRRSDFLPHELRSPVSRPKTVGVGLEKSFALQNLSPIGHSPPGTVPENSPQDCFLYGTFLTSFKSPSPSGNNKEIPGLIGPGISLLGCLNKKDILRKLCGFKGKEEALPLWQLLQPDLPFIY